MRKMASMHQVMREFRIESLLQKGFGCAARKWGGPPGPLPTPRSATSDPPHALRGVRGSIHYLCVMLDRRRLPHIQSTEEPVFLTWRLHGSLPPHRSFPTGKLPSGKAFAAMDHLSWIGIHRSFILPPASLGRHRGRGDPLQRRGPETLPCACFCSDAQPCTPVSDGRSPPAQLTKSLKGITAKRANALLALTGKPFWQEESYDRVVRQQGEFERIRNYIEQNPVRSGLAGK